MADPLRSRSGSRERLADVARLAAVGRLVPSLVHQLSTPLASIALRAESLSRDVETAAPAGGRAGRYLPAIVGDTERCKELLGTMREFSRPPGPAREPVDLNAACTGAARLLAHEAMRRQVEVGVAAADGLPSPVADEVRVRGAVLGLMLLAVDASPSGGRVSVETSVREGAVEVAVSGPGGAPAEGDLADAFEPFAEVRPGVLGPSLAACREAVEASGGTVAVQAQPGGRRCTLRLPCPPGGAASRERADGRGA